MSKRFEIKLIFLIIMLALLFTSLAIFFLINGRTHYQENFKVTGRNLVQLLEQSIADKARLIDDAVVRVEREMHRQAGIGSFDVVRLKQFLASEQEQLPEINTIRVTNAAGDEIWDKEGGTFGEPVDLADREFFKEHKEHATSDLIITQPITCKISGKWVIAFTRCYHTEDTKFAGVISATVPVETFSKLLSKVDLGRTGTVVIRSADMGLIARYPPIDIPVATPGNKKVSYEFSRIVESGVPTAIFHTAANADSVERTYSYSRVSGWPFTIAVGLVDEEYLAPWKTQAIYVSGLLVLFLLVILTFAWMATRHLRERPALEKTQIEDMTRRRILIEQSRDGIVVLDHQGKVWEANQRFCEMLGYTPDEMKDLYVWDWEAIMSQEQLLEAIERINPAGDFFETRHRRKDGIIYDVEISTNGAICSGLKLIFCVCREITERKRMEEKLNEIVRESRSAYSLMRMLCDNVPDMIWAKDLEKRYLFANKALCSDLLNASNTEEPIGKMDMFFAERERTRHPDNPEWHTFGEICRDTDALTMDAGTQQQFDEYGNVQGKFLFLDVRKAPFLDDTGRMIGTVGSARNVTTIKELERRLKKSEVSLRTLVQTIPDLVWLKGPTGVYLDCNDKFEKIFGATKKDIVGKTDYDFVDRELADFFREHDHRALTADAPTSNEEWLTFADNGYRGLFDTIKTPMYDAEGTLIGVLGISHDITGRKQAEEALQVSLAEKEVLLREVHHRVKNNMAAIIGLLNLQQSAMDNPQAQAAMADLSSRVSAMSLVHEKLYRSESLSHVDFQEYLQSLISHLRTSFGSPRIRCEIAAQGVEMPLDLAVPCGMIVNELIINSFKYAFPKERAEIEDDRIFVSLHQDNGTFILSVADNGVGLPLGFDLNNTNTLGLTLVQMIGQHQLGGHYVIDQVGGTRFTLTFSLQDGGKPYA